MFFCGILNCVAMVWVVLGGVGGWRCPWSGRVVLCVYEFVNLHYLCRWQVYVFILC